MWRRLIAARQGATAMELALILPVFVMFTFGTLEIAMINWYRSVLAAAADDAGEYMRRTRVLGSTFSEAGMRSAACPVLEAAFMSCDAASLKIAPFYAGQPDVEPIAIPTVVDNVVDPRRGGGGQYVVVVAYELNPLFPTSGLLLVNDGARYQIQIRSYVVPAERVIE